MQRYDQHFRKPPGHVGTPQNQPIPGTVPNNAGGFGFQVDHWERARRFLILGSEGGTFYVGERKLTLQNAQSLETCLNENPAMLANLIQDISVNNRAPKTDPAIFALALMAARGGASRFCAYGALPYVCRIPTHLFHFITYYKALGGKWNRSLRSAISYWYNTKPAHNLAYHLVKYKERDGWSNRDLIRLAHVSPVDQAHEALYRWALGGIDGVGDLVEHLPGIVPVAEQIKVEPESAPSLIRHANLPREAIPTELLNKPSTWDALLDNMPLTALIRNLGNLSKHGILQPFGGRAAEVIARVSSPDQITKARVHPLAMWIARHQYGKGAGLRGSGSWTPNPQVLDALEIGFGHAFGNVTPTGKRILVAVDVSGSMQAPVAGVEGLSARDAAALMAYIFLQTEPNTLAMGFSSTDRVSYGDRLNPSGGIYPTSLTKRASLSEVVRTFAQWSGGTDCSLPMIHALRGNIPLDAIIILTDSETWAGGSQSGHPVEALKHYRSLMNLPETKLVVVAMAANHVSVGDPTDPGVLQVVGLDTSVPQVVSEFIGG